MKPLACNNIVIEDELGLRFPRAVRIDADARNKKNF
jgi:hypothetical protein